MKFRKKPVVISAMQFTGMNQRDIVESFGFGLHDDHPFRWVGWDQLKIKTSEGLMSAATGDWIIKGIAGEFYPCKPDIFAATYEPESLPTPTGEERESAKEREEFEAFAINKWTLGKDSHRLERTMAGNYYDIELDAAWIGWQAASRRIAALQQRIEELEKQK